jgi:hypothetical protein
MPLGASGDAGDIAECRTGQVVPDSSRAAAMVPPAPPWALATGLSELLHPAAEVSAMTAQAAYRKLIRWFISTALAGGVPNMDNASFRAIPIEREMPHMRHPLLGVPECANVPIGTSGEPWRLTLSTGSRTLRNRAS